MALKKLSDYLDQTVLVSDSIAEDAQIAFEAGSHRELVRINYEDFERLARPEVMSYSCKTHPSKPEMEQEKGCC